MSSSIISLKDAVAGSTTVDRASKPTSTGGGCSTSGCGTPSAEAAIPASVLARINDHPCYSEEAHHNFARIHVAVAPACNIQCNYCNRKYDCANESRPGVVSERLSPEDAVRKVQAVAAKMPELSVVGIAGPGDALADYRHTFATFRLMREVLPDLRLCLSTNGLALVDHVETIKSLGIDHVTITMNAVDPHVSEGIYDWVYFNNRRLRGLEAATVLLDRQMEGLDALARADVLVKINSVLIPGINDDHLAKLNTVVRQHGAFIHNIMPLISDPAHGTYFGLNGQRGPSPEELQRVQDQVSGDARVMRHCRQCRADAVGLIGEDRGQEFTMAKLPETVEDTTRERESYRALIAHEQQDKTRQAGDARRTIRALELTEETLVAVCSKGGGRINEHFGHASEFKVYAADSNGLRFIGHRRIDRYCGGGEGDDSKLETTIVALAGIRHVLCAKIGNCPRQQLSEAGITVSDAQAFEYIESAIAAHFHDCYAQTVATERRA
ncbi:nitrogenase cofactor biosynthesis protein NifB [Defluviicoccus vanus]|uniref:FeMo cofactor biosynthesis protein NifB n=1 Tax=Defluviicoccus vanus TaxID=111831 RepID=A0A7H1N5H7_9PROT|nr:nitrogenase cofactor biosynthesis protein NifB [Defluviicoccus vanus]QNT70963.1 nitrogenase cofactor biosynthesis protein NifB [Defluviicoccus vanus]